MEEKNVKYLHSTIKLLVNMSPLNELMWRQRKCFVVVSWVLCEVTGTDERSGGPLPDP